MNPIISSELAALRERSLRAGRAPRRARRRRDETLFRSAPDSDLA